MSRLTFHLIANAHLDPVWLWDWREGMNEGLITCRTILDLMDRHESLTFIRGEAAVYEHIERTDPATFDRILRYIRQGRWDAVGGTYVQPDTNMPATETFARQYARGQQYFLSRFGRIATVAWAADSFGHAAGLPEVMAGAGIKGFAFTRPGAAILPLAKPAFWWVGSGGSRIMAYRPAFGWYGNERDEVPRRLEGNLEAARACDLENVGIFYGVGDHGGGPTWRMIQEIEAWAAAHPEVRVVHSGLHRLFDALYDEVARKGDGFLPTHHGEMNFVQRGCYSSAAKLKFLYRKTESLVSKVETTSVAVGASLGAAAPDLGEAWDAVLFNSFHDILPGSSIERAYDEQLPHLGLAFHRAQEAELSALNALAMQVDTQVAKARGDMPSALAAMVFNPHPHKVQTYVEMEANLDYRPITEYNNRQDELPIELLGPSGRPLPFQHVKSESNFHLHIPWRWRVVTPVTLPPLGWSVCSYGYVKNPRVAPLPKTGVRAKAGTIDSGIYRVQASKGSGGVKLFYKGKPLLRDEGLSVRVVEDREGSWGVLEENIEPEAPAPVLERFKVTDVKTLESGPLRAAMWVRLAGKRSSVELTFSVCHGREAVDVSARVLWNERSARLRLVMPCQCTGGEFGVPGATVNRGPSGEVPGRWVRVARKGGAKLGFASDALYSFECRDGEFMTTVCRATRYSAEAPMPPKEQLELAAVDRGELKFNFMLTPGNQDLPNEAALLEQPPTVLLVPAKPGRLGRQGSLAQLAPETVKLLALKPAADGKGVILRVQNMAARTAQPVFTWLGTKLKLGRVPAGQIACWRLTRSNKGWTAKATDLVER